MSEPLQPTPFADVNAVLHDFLAQIGPLLGSHFHALYLYGSLALGDFNPRTSDIDFLVVTDTDIDDNLFAGLRDMHARFNASGSPWANRVEAAYIPEYALRHSSPSAARYPQIETEGGMLVRDPLEAGWVFQRQSLRDYGIVLAGPDPQTVIDPVDLDDMRRAALAITGQWLDQAHHDPEWLAWVRQRNHQAFVVLTLCRVLYSLATGTVTSKPAAARWARETYGEEWATLIAHALAALTGQYLNEEASESEVRETVAFIEFTSRR
ncbi:MAG TPA: aminoglycoside adenylyltransferase domain-containing protein [Ktedonobacterales bacterium]|nr:aminoglycoside adenylyltransferase domain-containing protein [Ktedonobacterales bacterium]